LGKAGIERWQVTKPAPRSVASIDEEILIA